jgi:hypothetical protein
VVFRVAVDLEAHLFVVEPHRPIDVGNGYGDHPKLPFHGGASYGAPAGSAFWLWKFRELLRDDRLTDNERTVWLTRRARI